MSNWKIKGRQTHSGRVSSDGPEVSPPRTCRGNALPALSGRSAVRSLYVVGLMAAAVFTLSASTRPSAAVIIYPWCANYGGRMSGAQNCGFTSRQQCELTRAGNGGFCIQNPWYQPYPPPQTYAPPIRR